MWNMRPNTFLKEHNPQRITPLHIPSSLNMSYNEIFKTKGGHPMFSNYLEHIFYVG